MISETLGGSSYQYVLQESLFDVPRTSTLTGSLRDYRIEPLTYDTATRIVVAEHYLHRKAPCSNSYGLIDTESRIVGVVMYGASASTTLRTGICGHDEAGTVIELTRLWVSDSVPKNGESYLIGNTIRRLPYEVIVSYADTSVGHLGTIYQASNFLYTGLSAAFKDPKVRGREDQHHTTYAKGMTNRQVVERYGAENVYFVDRPRKHRYVYINAGKTRRAELLQKLRYPILPYPKRETVIEEVAV